MLDVPQRAGAGAVRTPSPIPCTARGRPDPIRSDPHVQALTELKALVDSGAVTQEEFEQEKKSLLEAAS